MTDASKRTGAICATILIVGLVFSAVLWVSLSKFNRSFLAKDFYSQNASNLTTDTYQTVRLNDRQFVVVSAPGNEVNVYQVDANGKLSRTSGTPTP